MDVQPTTPQQLCDSIDSIWIKIHEECFQHRVASVPRRKEGSSESKKCVNWGGGSNTVLARGI